MTTSITLAGFDVVLIALVCLFVLFLVTRSESIPKGLRLPPGPPPKPIVGNASDWPTHDDRGTFAKWAKQYGDLVYINLFGQRIMFVNSVEIARNLFEKRSSIYSDRTDLHMVNGLMGWDFAFSLMRYGSRWRRHRKMFHDKFHSTAVTAYLDVQTRQTRDTLQRLRESPDDFVAHIRHLAGATIMEIVYGIKVVPKDDPFIERAEKAMGALASAENPGTFLVDLFPILKYVPTWMPGASFRRKARGWKKDVAEMVGAPFVVVKEALRTGTAQPSFTKSLLEKLPQPIGPSQEEDDIRDVAAVAYVAGADITVSVLLTFFLAMVLYPEVQRKAQSELDSLIGMNRLPCFEDRESLPYINALCKELLRWHPALPLGVGHRVMEDDVYEDYFIPKGTVLFGNAWVMMKDEKIYGANPKEFKPERFLEPGVEDPTLAFGYGKRICPGRYMAQNSTFLAVTSILKVFNISRAKDSSGKDIPVEDLYTSSAIIIHPEPFPCVIEPRSSTVDVLLKERANN